MRISVVLGDDHPVVREGTRRMLEQCSDIVVVGEAPDGVETVNLVSSLHPDVALVDIAMPRLNGIEATRRIKELCPKTAVLILTAHEDGPYVFAVLEAGAAGYITKSTAAGNLVAAIKSVHAGESVLAPTVTRRVLERYVSSRPAEPQRRQEEAITPRQMAVLRLAARGLSNKAIAKELALSPRTVQLHLAHIFGAMGVASRTEAVMAAVRRGLVSMEEVS